MSAWVLGLREIDKTQHALVGGKGANLGELSKIEGVHVPDGFCITTEAFKRIVPNARVERLVSADGAEIRSAIEAAKIPIEIIDAIRVRIDESAPYAIRSSATAEDTPTASFAGQQDTYLNVIGLKHILIHVSKCWASLFTDRAIAYRAEHGFDHSKVQLAVVVQQMVFPQAAGVMFTADPVSGNRKVTSIDASFGLGEALVSGRVNADNYKVRAGQIIAKQIVSKKLATEAVAGGGTRERLLPPEHQHRQALTEDQILQLERLGRTIESHFGSPQDIEWCLAEGNFTFVQSRPITTLFPIPKASDAENRVYISVGHQQMMTDAMKPLGLSLHQLVAARPMAEAGGRLFVDITANLSTPAGQAMMLKAMREHDPLTASALETLIERGDFIAVQPDGPEAPRRILPPALDAPDPSIVAELIASSEASVAELKQAIASHSGAALFDFVREDIQRLKQILFDPRSSGVFMAAINATQWVNEHIEAWLGEKGVADILSRSVANNITSEMGLALLDVADAIRPYPDVIDYLQHARDDQFMEELSKRQGGPAARAAIEAFLDTYGMRCAGEIDLTRARWSEQPTALVPIILANLRNFAPAASARKFEHGRREAIEKEQDLLGRLRQLPDGEVKASETKEKIELIRNFIGYREYPKYGMVNRYFVYKQAFLREAEQLIGLREREDIYYLKFDELREAVRTQTVDGALIERRKAEHALFERLTPPRVITSDGEIIAGRYQRENLPANALVGLPVSAGLVEGRARVVLDLEAAQLEAGDILVTTFTDPSWTPLFVTIKALVTEVGGLMTHGAVIAREYGLPAVVGVEDATRRIRDGQRIRVHGTEGWVELL